MTQIVANRCQAILGFKPEIIKATPLPGELAKHLAYSNNKICKSNFYPLANINNEIDRTLTLCHEKD